MPSVEWEDQVQKYITLGEEIADRQWIQAGIVATVKIEFGGDAVREFGKVVRRGYSTLMKHAATFEKFRGPNASAKENPVLSFSHHVAVHNAANPEEWLAMAEDENIDARRLEDLARTNQDIDVAGIQGGYFDDEHWRTCPECRGRGKVPVGDPADQLDKGVKLATGGQAAPITAGGGMKRLPDPPNLKVLP